MKKLWIIARKKVFQLALLKKKCGIGNGTVSKWKDDVSKPSVTTLEKIAKETKIPITEWLK